MQIFSNQYSRIASSRNVVFEFCQSISETDYIIAVPNFGRGSIRSTHAHIVDTYLFWIGKFALQKEPTFLNHDEITRVDEIKREFEIVNNLVQEFIEQFERACLEPIKRNHPRKGRISLTPLELFTHVTTHEFHHKGQMMSMARILGYTPPDTDVIRV